MTNRGEEIQGNSAVLLGVGDIHPCAEEPPEPLFEHSAEFLRRGDITIGQLEVLFTDKGSLQMYPSAAHFIHVPPQYASCLPYAGFDIVSCASNHSMDWGPEALLDSLENVRRHGVITTGAGANIEEARQPTFLECKGTRVAFLDYCSVPPPGCHAQPQRAGVAPMRATAYYEPMEYQPGTPPVIVTIPNQEDLEALTEDIRRVRAQADVVVMSIHWGVHHLPKIIADYQPVVAHAAIDAGADLILGHHPHILKAVEVYKGKVVFYSLGNFAMGGVSYVPNPDLARRRRVRLYERMRDYFDPTKSSRPGEDAPWSQYPPDSSKTVVAKAVLRDKSIQRVSLVPAYINERSQPEVLQIQDPRFAEVVTYMEWLSEEFPHRFSVEGGEVVVDTSGAAI